MSYRAVHSFISDMLERFGIFSFSVDQYCYSYFLQVAEKKCVAIAYS